MNMVAMTMLYECLKKKSVYSRGSSRGSSKGAVHFGDQIKVPLNVILLKQKVFFVRSHKRDKIKFSVMCLKINAINKKCFNIIKQINPKKHLLSEKY